jgi:predicted Rossmann-fold nucleotide-binding protein
MGIAADAAMKAGAEVIGIIPEVLMNWEVGRGADDGACSRSTGRRARASSTSAESPPGTARSS